MDGHKKEISDPSPHLQDGKPLNSKRAYKSWLFFCQGFLGGRMHMIFQINGFDYSPSYLKWINSKLGKHHIFQLGHSIEKGSKGA